MTALAWQRHELPPWERKRGHTAEYAVQLDDEPKGMESTVVLFHGQIPRRRHVVWAAVYYPAGCRGVGLHICIVLFTTRTLKAAQRLTELWWSTKPPKEAASCEPPSSSA